MEEIAESEGISRKAVMNRIKRAKGEPVAASLKAVDVLQREIDRADARLATLRKEIEDREAERRSLVQALEILRQGAA